MAKADEDAIREIELRFNDAWGRHDVHGMVESLADDAQFVTVNGAWTKTRAEYLDLMGRLHGANGPSRSSKMLRCVFRKRMSGSIDWDFEDSSGEAGAVDDRLVVPGQKSGPVTHWLCVEVGNYVRVQAEIIKEIIALSQTK
jgi:hypothetical protein